MADNQTYADMLRALDEPVATPPQPDWCKDAYRIVPAPLAATLEEGDVIDLGDRRFEVLDVTIAHGGHNEALSAGEMRAIALAYLSAAAACGRARPCSSDGKRLVRQ